MQNEARLKMLLQSVTVLERHKCSSARSLRRVGLILLTLTTQLKSSISHSSKSPHVHTSVRRTKLLAIWNLLVVQLYRAEFPPFCMLLQGTATLWAVPSRVISWTGLRL